MNPDSRRAPTVGLCVFAAALLGAATFYFLGDIGHFNDDYFYLQRDPITHEVRSLVLDRPVHVWRPLFRAIMPALQTLLWDHAWIKHALSALLHAGVVLGLFAFLRRAGVSWRIASASALGFAVYPAHQEAVFWLCCIPTLMACNLLLLAANLHLWWIRREGEAEGIARLYPLVLGGISFAIAALNEQPAGPLAVLPLLALVAVRPANLTFLAACRRAVVPAVFAAAALVVYLKGHFAFMARAGVVAPPSEGRIAAILRRIGRVWQSAPDEFLLKEYAAGALRHGIDVVSHHPFLGVAFGGGLVVGLACLVRPWMLGPRDDSASPRDAASWAPGPALALFGVCWMVAAWLPIVAVHASTTSRLHYPSDIGAAMTIAGVLHTVLHLIRSRGAVSAATIAMLRGVGGSAALVGLLLCTIMMIGQQDVYRRRSERDLSEARQLLGVVPDAPAGTIFLPVRVDSAVVHTGSSRFDHPVGPAWCWEYAAGWNLQQVFRRTDVHCGLVGPRRWMRLHSWPGAERSKFLMLSRIADPQPVNPPEKNPGGSGRLLPFDRVVPFAIDEAGTVTLYTGAYLASEFGAADAGVYVDFPIAKRAHANRGLPDRLLTFRPPPPNLVPSSE